MMLGICQTRLVEDPGLDVHPGIEQDAIAFIDELKLLRNGVSGMIEENSHVSIAFWTVVAARPGAKQVPSLQVLAVPGDQNFSKGS